MRGFRWIALQGSSRGLFSPALLLFCFITTSGILPAHAADDPTACRTPVARIVSVQGTIELLRARENDWSKVTRLDTSLCEGDRLRTGALSRAALFIQPETLVRIDQNTRITVSQSAEETLVEFTQEELLPAASGAYSCGAGYFITRFPRKFRVNTPHLNAAVEGTEFLVAMRCEATELSVFEGKVLAAGAGANVFPAQTISSGQVLTIGGSEPPTIKFLVKPADAVQWVVYYPPLSDTTAEADLPSAEQCRSLPKPLDQTCLTQRAEVLLRLGRVDEAQREVDEAVALDPGGGDANALRAIISIARNDKASAIEAATAATTASPNSTRAWLALSYAQQARFKLEDSLSSARKAQALEPNSSVTNARVAELLMSLGRIKDAEVAARAAVDANPAESRPHTVLGFVHLAQIRTKAAREDFQAAIECDSSDPLPRLGLGLAIIRDGKLVEGREQIEIAVALDPTNSLLRSYVGKAYYEENRKERDQLAETQYGLAKQLDANDPTPWFYDAIRKALSNDPIGAIRDLQESVERNDNRAVYRSNLLLDQDRGSRNASTARAYQDLGFDQVALSLAANSLVQDPFNYSAHRFLADAYAVLPRHGLARESELLQAQLRQPLAIIPVPPLRTQGSLSSTAPKPAFATNLQGVAVGFNEYDALIEGPGPNVILDGLVGSRNTLADQFLISTVQDNVALSFGQGHFESFGIKKNSDINENTINGLMHVQVSPDTFVQTELRYSSSNRGATFTEFDPSSATPVKVDEGFTELRLGLRHVISSQSELLFSVVGASRDTDLVFLDFPFTSKIKGSSGSAELQSLTLIGPAHVIAGAGGLNGRTNFETIGTLFVSEFLNAYVYGSLAVPMVGLQFQAGVAYETIKEGPLERELVSPKLGVLWHPFPTTTLRATGFQSLKRQLVSNRTIEPTQVAGFNQFFDDLNGAITRRFGIGLDQAISKSAYVGVETSKRRLTVPLFVSEFEVVDFEWRERASRLYFYFAHSMPADQPICGKCSFAISTELQYERFDRPVDFPGDAGIVNLEDTLLPIAATFIPNALVSARIEALRVRQHGQLQASASSVSFAVDNDYWLTNLSLAYRLPRRRGVIRGGVDNLFDKRVNFVEVDPTTPRVSVARFAFVSLKLQF